MKYAATYHLEMFCRFLMEGDSFAQYYLGWLDEYAPYRVWGSYDALDVMEETP